MQMTLPSFVNKYSSQECCISWTVARWTDYRSVYGYTVLFTDQPFYAESVQLRQQCTSSARVVSDSRTRITVVPRVV